jgi:hypothetical protein
MLMVNTFAEIGFIYSFQQLIVTSIQMFNQMPSNIQPNVVCGSRDANLIPRRELF